MSHVARMAVAVLLLLVALPFAPAAWANHTAEVVIMDGFSAVEGDYTITGTDNNGNKVKRTGKTKKGKGGTTPKAKEDLPPGTYTLTGEYTDDKGTKKTGKQKFTVKKKDLTVTVFVDKSKTSAENEQPQHAAVPAAQDDPRAALEEQQSALEQQQQSQTDQVAAFTPAFLDRRQAFLAELPADMRGYIASGGSNDWAGRTSVTYTRLKIQIEMQAAANEGRDVPEALTALANLYNQMSGYHSAVLDTESQVAQTQKDIAHTVVDERAYAMGGDGGEGGEGGGGGGGGEGGN